MADRVPWRVADGFSSPVRPVLHGDRGAVSAAHPLAVAAGQMALAAGGSAVDAAIAAQAVLCVVAPDACGLGGDMFALIADGERTIAVNGAGAAPLGLTQATDDGPDSITVPGIVSAWEAMHRLWGKLDLAQVLSSAIRLTEQGMFVSAGLARAVDAQRGRLERHGARGWALLAAAAHDRLCQPELAALLRDIARQGSAAFYHGSAADAIVATVRKLGGALDQADLARHETELTAPLSIRYADCEVLVQPPPTQGILLAMALQGLAGQTGIDDGNVDHLGVEFTEAAFAFRDRAHEGSDLLREELAVDPERAALRGGPRAYLHTAGVSVADASGLVVSSLVSVFDDFGSCVFVPELGITLNNRAGGFTFGANAAAPGKKPVHTLAPALLRDSHGVLALATPGADGQIQTLLQVIDRIVRGGQDLASAIAAPRWRSEGGALLIEDSHPARQMLGECGHRLAPMAAGDMRFGAIACAGFSAGRTIAVADWRRDSWAGVA